MEYTPKKGDRVKFRINETETSDTHGVVKYTPDSEHRFTVVVVGHTEYYLDTWHSMSKT